ncbi:MAG: hypothetical protein KatS3mg017_1027 [Fimbriimonadales bacterium]|nr:MAG: hypothetical protein KatS3mg017_1027 [Fimbriimonadales bacterium]GIV10169.1 MAG: hypothetical protein KatS3mg019_2260 [Fimbriimonadales bacterium]
MHTTSSKHRRPARVILAWTRLSKPPSPACLDTTVQAIQSCVLGYDCPSHPILRAWTRLSKPPNPACLDTTVQAIQSCVLGYDCPSHPILRAWIRLPKPSNPACLDTTVQATKSCVLGHDCPSHESCVLGHDCPSHQALPTDYRQAKRVFSPHSSRSTPRHRDKQAQQTSLKTTGAEQNAQRHAFKRQHSS